MYSVRNDSKLSIICQLIAERIPTSSIFICGSRATGQGIIDSSDYDVGVVMNTLLVPFYLVRLKELERRLSQELNLDLVINPLPTFRLHRARGNLFLFKLKREGATLRGHDCLQMLEPGGIEDIGVDWYFSYLFCAMKELLRSFNPELINAKPDKEQAKILIQDAAKAILHCGDIQLLMKRHYEANPEDMISKLHQLNLPNINNPRFLKDIDCALSARKGELDGVQDPLGFWFRTREYLLSTFQVLLRSYPRDDNDNNIKELAIKYSKVGNKARLKNLQYFILNLLTKRQILWRSLITGYSVEKRLWMALLWLLLSVDQGRPIDKECLLQGYNMLNRYATIDYSEDEVAFWHQLRQAILEHFPLACTVMGI